MTREERATVRRREMLAAFYQVLVEEGLRGASIAKIAKRLDVPPSLIIHYFHTREQMTIELVDYLLEAYHESYGDKLAAVPDPLERLHAILDEFFSPEYHKLLDDRAFYACFYLSLTTPACARPTPSSTSTLSSSSRRRCARPWRRDRSPGTTLTSWRWS